MVRRKLPACMGIPMIAKRRLLDAISYTGCCRRVRSATCSFSRNFGLRLMVWRLNIAMAGALVIGLISNIARTTKQSLRKLKALQLGIGLCGLLFLLLYIQN